MFTRAESQEVDNVPNSMLTPVSPTRAFCPILDLHETAIPFSKNLKKLISAHKGETQNGRSKGSIEREVTFLDSEGTRSSVREAENAKQRGPAQIQ